MSTVASSHRHARREKFQPLELLRGRFSKRWNFLPALLLVLAACVAGARAETVYTVRDLGTLGGANSRAYGIGENGWVVGEAETAGGLLHAFVWTPTNGMTDLGTLGGDISRAYAVNDRGQVVGEAELADGRMQAFAWSADGGMTNLALPEGFRESYAYANNNFGVVVGAGDVGEGTRALVWSVDGAQVPAPLAEEGSSIARAVNDLGDVAGQAETGGAESFLSRAFFDGHAGFFPNLGGVTGDYSSAALVVNARGLAAGYAERGEATHAMVFDPTNGWVDLDTLDNAYSVAYGLNDRGEAVGQFVSSHEDEDRAFVWADGGMADLNELLESDDPWLLVEGRGINNAGEIAGYGLLNEREHAVLLTPSARRDSARPEVRVTRPAPGAVYNEGANVDLLAEAASRAGLRRVTFYANGAILGTATGAPYRLAWSNVAAGTYNLIASAVDVRGRSRRSARVPIKVALGDNRPPSVGLIEPDDGTALALGSNILLRAEASDPDGEILHVTFLADGSNVATVGEAMAEFVWTPPGTGLFTVVAEAVDDAGLRATSGPARVNVTAP